MPLPPDEVVYVVKCWIEKSRYPYLVYGDGEPFRQTADAVMLCPSHIHDEFWSENTQKNLLDMRPEALPPKSLAPRYKLCLTSASDIQVEATVLCKRPCNNSVEQDTPCSPLIRLWLLEGGGAAALRSYRHDRIVYRP